MRKPCPQYYIELGRVMQLEEIRRKFEENQPLFDELTAITGQKTNNFDGVQDIYSTLKAEVNQSLLFLFRIKNVFKSHRKV